MDRPLIGITPSCADGGKRISLPRAYLAAVEAAGGIPLVLPHTADRDAARQLTALCGGIIFSGGADVDPRLYNEAPWFALGETAPVRDVTDPLFFETARELGKPILGICRGLQLVNVCMGGSLYQDLDTQAPDGSIPLLDHRATSKDANARHSVIAEEGSFVARAYGSTEFAVNTYHHQAVKTPAPGLRVTARALDGTVEAMEGTDGAFLALCQWHPEMLPKCPGSKKVFELFVRVCGGK